MIHVLPLFYTIHTKCAEHTGYDGLTIMTFDIIIANHIDENRLQIHCV